MPSHIPTSQVRNIPIGTRSVTGKHALNGIPYESSLERDFLTLCAFDTNIESVLAQPVKIPYRTSKNRPWPYTPDFLVRYRGSPSADSLCQGNTLCEIKPKAKLLSDKAQLDLKFEAATRYAKEQGWEFRVFTEEEIRTPFLINVRFLLPYRNIAFDLAVARSLLTKLHELGDTSNPQALISAAFPDKNDQLLYLPVLWHLVATRQICANLNTPLSQTSPIWTQSDGAAHEKT